jgi:hypothetical protein
MDNKSQIIKDILAELSLIKDAIQNKKLDQLTRDKLFEKQSVLQSKLNELLKKKGILTDTESDKLYQELRLQKRNLLESQSKRGYTAFYIGAGILIIGLYFAFKKKKS